MVCVCVCVCARARVCTHIQIYRYINTHTGVLQGVQSVSLTDISSVDVGAEGTVVVLGQDHQRSVVNV